MVPDLYPLPPADTDYVRCFDALSKVEVEIRRRGPSPHLMLRRAILHHAIGNYVVALRAAQDAVGSSPREPEAHYQEGLAWLALARVQCGACTLAPGTASPAPRPLMTLIERAYEAFCAAADAGTDDDAAAAARWLEELLMMDEPDAADALRT